MQKKTINIQNCNSCGGRDKEKCIIRVILIELSEGERKLKIAQK